MTNLPFLLIVWQLQNILLSFNYTLIGLLLWLVVVTIFFFVAALFGTDKKDFINSWKFVTYSTSLVLIGSTVAIILVKFI
ncbi:MAG: hypothetical protein LBM27_03850 [Lactobacillaceae bacterium]|nr:hypothetical protein [Lactobacillaceae bacterium]